MKKIIRNILMGVYLLGAMLLVFSCDDKLDVQQVYPFMVTTMPVQKRIKMGETAKISFQLQREGYYGEKSISSGISSRMVKVRFEWRMEQFFFQMICTRFRVKRSACTILPLPPTSTQLTYILKIASDRWYS